MYKVAVYVTVPPYPLVSLLPLTIVIQTPRTTSTSPKELLELEHTDAKPSSQIATAAEEWHSDTTAAPKHSVAFDQTIAAGVAIAEVAPSDDEKNHDRIQGSESTVVEKGNHVRIQDSESEAVAENVDNNDDDNDCKQDLPSTWLNPTGEPAVQPWKTLMGIPWPAGIQAEVGTVFCHRWKSHGNDSLAGWGRFGEESRVHRAWGTTAAAKAIMRPGRGASGLDPAPGSLLGTILRLVAGVRCTPRRASALMRGGPRKTING